VIASLVIGAIVGAAVCVLVGHVIARRRRSSWPASTAAQLRDERKRRRLKLDSTNTNLNRWSSHR
jgi:hypothetical protein